MNRQENAPRRPTAEGAGNLRDEIDASVARHGDTVVRNAFGGLASPNGLDSLPRMYSASQLAERIGSSAEHIRRMIRNGELRAYKFGGRLKIAEPDALAVMLRYDAQGVE